MTIEELQELIEISGKDLYSFCLHLTGSVEQGEDLYQETFLQAVRKLDQIDVSRNVKSYLCGIAVRLQKNESRKADIHNRIAPILEDQEGDRITNLAVPSESGQEGLTYILSKEQRSEVMKAVNALSDKYRIPVLLFYMEELPVKEIARILGIPKGTVLSRLRAARKQLRSTLEVYYHEGDWNEYGRCPI